jgi:Fe-S cluster assembly iron-binding protein IscA
MVIAHNLKIQSAARTTIKAMIGNQSREVILLRIMVSFMADITKNKDFVLL